MLSDAAMLTPYPTVWEVSLLTAWWLVAVLAGVLVWRWLGRRERRAA